ncbi:hypothetical protein Thiowin_04475 [Thiorhodovibrio winogradskyi]|uniref:Uncharacterized protein n=1 Tax=Thiorhodovibrio winogradskyi TaxID=77007 RepID=A0ABZ0SE96_9GAMM|nr:hypothetical protein [Thiorhodovibrio winogradskyi]
MGESRHKVVTKGSAPCLLTCSAVNWVAIFANPAIDGMVLDSPGCLHENPGLLLRGDMLMENYLHLVASSPKLQKEIGDFPSFTARSHGDWLIPHHRQWVTNLPPPEQTPRLSPWPTTD